MSDQPEHVPNLKAVVKEAQVSNLSEPWEFKVGDAHIPRNIFNVVYTANTFHIMGWKECKTLIKSAGGALPENGLFMVYGPFKYNEQFTSPSNEAFDQTLRERDPASGIRSFEDVDRAMLKNGMELVEDHEMPSNNRLLVYKRQKFVRK